MTDALPGRRDAMRRLGQSFGRAYVIFSGDGTFSATRLDNGQDLIASSPGELHGKIEADLAARPVAAWALGELP